MCKARVFQPLDVLDVLDNTCTYVKFIVVGQNFTFGIKTGVPATC